MNRKSRRPSNLGMLIGQLDNKDPAVWKAAQREIAAYGKGAIPDLIHHLEKGSQSAQRASATLIGKLGNAKGAEVRALERSLFSDDDAKLRKNAAMALGRLKCTPSLGILKQAVETETMDWVKPSIILAIGAIGGGRSKEILHTIVPNTNAQKEAVRKALGLAENSVPDAKWVDGKKITGVYAEVPAGLETIAIQESRKIGFPADRACSGLIHWQENILPNDVFPRLRCIHNLLIPLAVAKAPIHSPMTKWPDEVIIDQLTALLRGSQYIKNWKDWLEIDADTVNFRFFLAGEKVSPRIIKKLSRISRDTLGQWKWFDNPYSYSVELGLMIMKKNIALVIRPSFMKDQRFMYRQKDVGASINPVVAACLAFLAGPSHGGCVTDPTCGSGTLLIESAFLDDAARLQGIDISPRAIAAATTNIESAGLTHRTRLLRGDAGNVDIWRKSRIVIANLPFGIRSRPESKSLNRLYCDVIRNAYENVLEDGRIILCTSKRNAIDSAIHETGVKLKTVQTLETISGGIKIYISVLIRQ